MVTVIRDTPRYQIVEGNHSLFRIYCKHDRKSTFWYVGTSGANLKKDLLQMKRKAFMEYCDTLTYNI